MGKLENFTNGGKRNYCQSMTMNRTKKEDRKLNNCQKGLKNRSSLDVLFAYSSLFFLIILGLVNDIIRPITRTPKNRQNYAELYEKKKTFYFDNIFDRIMDILNTPITSLPGVELTVLERIPIYNRSQGFKITGKEKKCINFGSYNYLGLGDNKGFCTEVALESVNKLGVSCCATRAQLGNSFYHKELETLVAKFIGTEDAITCAMGFATNALTLPTILNKNCLVLSDKKNHASIILGLKVSGAKIRTFEHNDLRDLENCLRVGIISGQPRTRLPWEKIFIVVEGIYSMEGTVVNLPDIIALKNKYKAYLYLDEAHSIGAMGQTGRGIVEHFNCDPNDVDILMGTFTKSFGAAGGYISGSKALIETLRNKSAAHIYGTAMPPSVAYQIISAIKFLMGEDGTDEGVRRLNKLRRNVRYFRKNMEQLGFIVYGNDSSPVVPVVIFVPPKVLYFVRELLKRGIAAVGVSYPVTSFFEGRLRFCISSSHTKEMLDYAITSMRDIRNEIMFWESTTPDLKENIVY